MQRLIRILILEKDSETAIAFLRMFRSFQANIEVVCVTSLDAAYDHLKKRRYDAHVVDADYLLERGEEFFQTLERGRRDHPAINFCLAKVPYHSIVHKHIGDPYFHVITRPMSLQDIVKAILIRFDLSGELSLNKKLLEVFDKSFIDAFSSFLNNVPDLAEPILRNRVDLPGVASAFSVISGHHFLASVSVTLEKSIAAQLTYGMMGEENPELLTPELMGDVIGEFLNYAGSLVCVGVRDFEIDATVGIPQKYSGRKIEYVHPTCSKPLCLEVLQSGEKSFIQKTLHLAPKSFVEFSAESCPFHLSKS